MSVVLTWILLALIPVVPVILALVPGLDEPRNADDAETPAARDDDGPLILAA